MDRNAQTKRSRRSISIPNQLRRDSEEERGCISKLCFSKRSQENKEQEKENGDNDLDGFLGFMRRDQASNPMLKQSSGITSENKSRSSKDRHSYRVMMDARQSENDGKGKQPRDEHIANMHVIEDIYYNVCKKQGSIHDPGFNPSANERITWKPYDATAFKPVRMHMAKGTIGQIHLLQHIASGYLGVMKVIPPNRVFHARTELNVLIQCSNSPFILQVVDAFHHEKTSYIYLEYAPFKTLDELAQITEGVGSQNAVLFAMEILLALQYLHSLRILHRDVKPENVFVLISGHIKLGDFSSAVFIDPKTNKTKGLCGTYVTRAPEVWAYDYYTYPVDVWAFGISMYNIISNTWPIVHASQDKQINHVNRGDIIYSNIFTPEAADLISMAVQPKPGDRWPVTQLISHPYFANLKDPFPAPYTPNELLEMHSFSSATAGEDLSFIQDMVAHLP